MLCIFCAGHGLGILFKKGTREMNNEPVAWMYEKPNGASKLSFVKEKMLWEDMTETPLYPHPIKEVAGFFGASEPVYPTIKELTDEEIMLVSDEFKGIPVTSVDAWNKVILLFGKAILRKAQEK